MRSSVLPPPVRVDPARQQAPGDPVRQPVPADPVRVHRVPVLPVPVELLDHGPLLA
jgi:hypothetical protein